MFNFAKQAEVTQANVLPLQARVLRSCLNMKNFIILLMMLFVLAPTSIQANNQKKGKAKIEFESLVYNMGTFSADSSVIVCHYTFKNTGDADLYIHQVFTSCGCTIASHNTDAVKPGESDTITVKYDGRRNAPGKIRKRITVHNNSDTEMVKLYLTGKMLPKQEQETEIIEVSE